MKISAWALILCLLPSTLLAQMSGEKTIFTLEKSMNAENILLVHTQTDESCKFVKNGNGYLDFYWLMDRTHRKEVHSLIRSKVEERVKFLGMDQSERSFKVQLNDLSEISHDLEEASIEVKAEINNGVCEVKSLIRLGASANYRKLNLKRTYCQVEKNMVGVPTGCKYLELQGVDADNGTGLKVRFKAK